MCNDYRMRVTLDTLNQDFSETRLPLRFPEGAPNMEPREDVRITEMAPIIRASADGEGAELVQRRWSWPGPGGKPVYNFRSDGRQFGSGRCLIVTDGFYEFTKPDDPKQKLKHKWLFTKAGEPWFCIAGLWRSDPQVGEAFTMLTAEPGPDVAPYHSRQVAVLHRADWADWIGCKVPAPELIRTLPAGTLQVTQVR
jgi:putative SOS response-associated peptidase YedK